MVVTIAKLGTAEMVGRFALAFAITAPVFALAAMNMRAVLATDQRNDHDFGEYLSLQLVLLGLAALASTSIAASCFSGDTWPATGLVALAKLVEGISELYLGYLQRAERMHLVSRSLSMKGVLSVSALTIGLWAGGTIEWGIVGLLLAWTAVLLLFDLRAASNAAHTAGAPSLRPRWRFNAHAQITRTALPLGISVCLSSLLMNIPRYFIERTLGVRELGIFAALAYFMIVGARIVTALGESATPRLARYHMLGDVAAFRLLLSRMTLVGIAVGATGVVGALTIGGPLLSFAYSPEYANSSNVLIVLMIASAFNYVAAFYQYAATATRSFRGQPLVVAMSVAVLAILCELLVPRYGSIGAGLAMTAGFVVQVIGFVRIAGGTLRATGATTQ